MSRLISIANFLRDSGGRAGQSDSDLQLKLIHDLLERVEQQVLCGSSCEHLRRQLKAVREDLPQSEASAITAQVTDILSSYQRQQSTLSVANALEMQKIIAMLNGTLQLMAAGSERSVSRLKEIETSLVGASKIDDIVALKARLTDCLAFVRTETIRGREDLNRTLATVEEDFRRAQEVLLFCSQGTPSRPEALQLLAQLASRSPTEGEWFVAVLVLRRFELVAKRFGITVADQLLLELISQRLQPFTRTASVFRWARDSVVLVIQRDVPLAGLQQEINDAVSRPLDYKVPVGNRVAVLNISCKWAVWAGTNTQFQPLVAKIDSFTGSDDGNSGE